MRKNKYLEQIESHIWIAVGIMQEKLANRKRHTAALGLQKETLLLSKNQDWAQLIRIIKINWRGNQKKYLKIIFRIASWIKWLHRIILHIFIFFSIHPFKHSWFLFERTFITKLIWYFQDNFLSITLSISLLLFSNNSFFSSFYHFLRFSSFSK